MLGAFPELGTTCYKRIFFNGFCFQVQGLGQTLKTCWIRTLHFPSASSSAAEGNASKLRGHGAWLCPRNLAVPDASTNTALIRPSAQAAREAGLANRTPAYKLCFLRLHKRSTQPHYTVANLTAAACRWFGLSCLPEPSPTGLQEREEGIRQDGLRTIFLPSFSSGAGPERVVPADPLFQPSCGVTHFQEPYPAGGREPRPLFTHRPVPSCKITPLERISGLRLWGPVSTFPLQLVMDVGAPSMTSSLVLSFVLN